MAGLLGKPPRPKAYRPPPPKAENGTVHADGSRTFGERRADDLTPEEKLHAELAKRLEEDSSLRGRPALRWVRRYLATTPLLQMDGTPVVGKDGKAVPLSLEEHYLQAIVRAAVMPGPDQKDWARMVGTLLVGPALLKPEVIEAPPRGAEGSEDAQAAGGGPIDDGRIPSAEEIQAETAELQRLSQIALAPMSSAHDDRDLTAIDVKAELVKEMQGKKEGDG